MKNIKRVIKICCVVLLFSFCLVSCEQKSGNVTHTTETVTSAETETNEENTTYAIITETSPVIQDDIIVSPDESDGFSVTFYPVGKGDCIIVRCGGETMMIDSGYKRNSDEILEYLSENNIKRLDIIIATHPDKDHIGAFADMIVSGIEIGILYKTEAVKGDAKTYENFISAIETHGVRTKNPAVGSRIKFGNAIITFLGPVIKYYKDINDSSIVIRLDYAGKSFLLTGDILSESESVLLNGEYATYLRSDILKVSHHGGNDATSYDFLREVSPEYAVITSDKNNGEPPAKSVIKRIEDIGADILRTDIEGLIRISVSATGDIDVFTDESYVYKKNEKNSNDDQED